MEKKPGEKPPERRSPAAGNQLLWYLLAVGAALILVMTIFPGGSQFELPIVQVFQLIGQGSPERNPDAKIDVTEGAEGHRLQVRYSNLHDLRAAPHEITGKVTRQVIGPKDAAGEPKQDVSFHSSRSGLENDDGMLLKALLANGFGDGRGTDANGWRAWLPMLALTAGFVCLILFVAAPTGRARIGHGLRPQPRAPVLPGRHRRDVRRRGRH